MTTWYPKEKDEEAWLPREKAKPPSQEAVQDYAQLYVYGSHLQPGLERTPEYLTPREREAVSQETVRQRYEESLEERSGILARREERNIIAEQLLGQRRPFYEGLTRGVGLLSEAETQLNILGPKLYELETKTIEHVILTRQHAYEARLALKPFSIADWLYGQSKKMEELSLMEQTFGLPSSAKGMKRVAQFARPFDPFTTEVPSVSGALLETARLSKGLKTFPFSPETITQMQLGKMVSPQWARLTPGEAATSILADVFAIWVVGKAVEKIFAPKTYAYGKQAVDIEKAWSWETPSVKGTAGMLEEAYGMPFYRQQTLWYETPVKEWARVRYVEWLAPRVGIESVFGWEEQVLGFVAGKPAWVTVPSRVYFETQQSLIMRMPVEPKPEKWFLRTVGYPQTPMEVTLKRAMETRAFGELSRGGLSAYVRLDVTFKPIRFDLLPSQFYTAPTKLYTETFQPPKLLGLTTSTRMPSVFPWLGITAIAKPSLRKEGKKRGLTALITPPSLISALKTLTIQLPRLETVPIQTLRTRQKVKTTQMQLLQPIQIQRQLLQQTEIQKQVTTKQYRTVLEQGFWAPSPPKQFLEPPLTIRLPQFPRSLKREGKGLFGAWFKRTHSIKSPEQLMQAFYGKRIKRGKAKRSIGRLW